MMGEGWLYSVTTYSVGEGEERRVVSRMVFIAWPPVVILVWGAFLLGGLVAR